MSKNEQLATTIAGPDSVLIQEDQNLEPELELKADTTGDSSIAEADADDESSRGLTRTSLRTLYQDIEEQGGLEKFSRQSQLLDELGKANPGVYGQPGSKKRRQIANRVQYLKRLGHQGYVRQLNKVNLTASDLSHKKARTEELSIAKAKKRKLQKEALLSQQENYSRDTCVTPESSTRKRQLSSPDCGLLQNYHHYSPVRSRGYSTESYSTPPRTIHRKREVHLPHSEVRHQRRRHYSPLPSSGCSVSSHSVSSQRFGVSYPVLTPNTSPPVPSVIQVTQVSPLHQREVDDFYYEHNMAYNRNREPHLLPGWPTALQGIPYRKYEWETQNLDA